MTDFAIMKYLLFSFTIAFAACKKKEEAKGGEATSSAPASAAGSTSSTPSPTSSSKPGTSAGAGPYGDSTDELKRMVTGLASKSGALIAAGMEPDEKWYIETFGAEVGGKLAAEVAPRKGTYSGLAGLFKKQMEMGKTNIVVEKFSKPGDKATGYQNAALKAMKKPVALYSVRMIKPGEKSGYHLWSFVHAGDTFKFVGKMEALFPKKNPLMQMRVEDAKEILKAPPKK